MHHAYLLIGDSDSAEKFFHLFWQERGVALHGSPDFFLWKIPVFGIDEARELNAQAMRKAFAPRLPSGQAGRKIFLISSERITSEAQNALLKTFEDPYPATHFFLVVREEALILPTLRSRMQILRVKSLAFDKSEEAQNFFSLPLKGRLNFAKEFSDDGGNLSVFLDELLRILRSRKIYDVRKWSDDRGAAPRLILEHLSLVL